MQTNVMSRRSGWATARGAPAGRPTRSSRSEPHGLGGARARTGLQMTGGSKAPRPGSPRTSKDPVDPLRRPRRPSAGTGSLPLPGTTRFPSSASSPALPIRRLIARRTGDAPARLAPAWVGYGEASTLVGS